MSYGVSQLGSCRMKSGLVSISRRWSTHESQNKPHYSRAIQRENKTIMRLSTARAAFVVFLGLRGKSFSDSFRAKTSLRGHLNNPEDFRSSRININATTLLSFPPTLVSFSLFGLNNAEFRNGELASFCVNRIMGAA